MNVLDFFAVAYFFIVLGVCCWMDLRTRTIPDWITLGIFAVPPILYHFAIHGWMVGFMSIIGFCTYSIIGITLYLVGQWGGADAKLLGGMGAWITAVTVFEVSDWFWAFLFFFTLTAVLYHLAWKVWRWWRGMPQERGVPFAPVFALATFLTAICLNTSSSFALW